jgi:hypothetical protein
MKQPDEYQGKQLLLSSGRIVIIGHDNDIFLNSMESISLSSNKSLNFDTSGHFIINSPTIYLGVESVNKSQPLVRGNDMRDIISKLVDSLEQLILITEKTPADIPSSLVLGLSMVKASIQNIKESYGKDLNKSLSTKTYVV